MSGFVLFCCSQGYPFLFGFFFKEKVWQISIHSCYLQRLHSFM